MAYRRRQGITRASTFKEEIFHPPDSNNTTNNNDNNDSRPSRPTFSSSHSFSSSSSASQSLAAQAIRASAAHRESSLSSAYGGGGGGPDSAFPSEPQRSKAFTAYGNASNRNDTKGFWGVLARKAKAILEDEGISQQCEPPTRSRWEMSEASPGGQFQQPSHSSDGIRNLENPRFRRGLDKLTSSLNQIGDTFEKAFEGGRTIVESKTADILQETRKLQNRRKGISPDEQNKAPDANSSWQPLLEPQNQANHDTQLKASRDVAMATAAKAKLLLRELKTVKADLAFAKQRCTQLEEENKLLRESREKGQNPADDDLIRLQLETLLAEKARLAHENSIYARENRFLREIVEYHQLTMQDVVYLDEGTEEVTEVYPITIPPCVNMLSDSPTSPTSPPSPSDDIPGSRSTSESKEIFPLPSPSEETDNVSNSKVPPTSSSDAPSSLSSKVPEENEAKLPSIPSV